MANLGYHAQLLSLDRFGELLHAFLAFTASVCNLRLHDRGTVYIRSFDPDEASSTQSNYLSDPRDLKVATNAIRLIRRIVATPALAVFRPQEYKSDPEYCSEEDLQRAAAETGTAIFHPAGICRMGQGPQTVVDTQLRVHGVLDPRIADASITSSLTSGNTCSSMLVIAEKAAQMILAERRCEAVPQVVESAMATGGKEAVEVRGSLHPISRGVRRRSGRR